MSFLTLVESLLAGETASSTSRTSKVRSWSRAWCIVISFLRKRDGSMERVSVDYYSSRSREFSTVLPKVPGIVATSLLISLARELSKRSRLAPREAFVA